MTTKKTLSQLLLAAVSCAHHLDLICSGFQINTTEIFFFLQPNYKLGGQLLLFFQIYSFYEHSQTSAHPCVLYSLHWLPVCFRFDFKSLMFGLAYLSDVLMLQIKKTEP